MSFKKAYSKRVISKQTEIISDGFHFSVKGSAKNNKEFIDMFILQRADEEYVESNFVSGVYNKELDRAYVNLLEVLESKEYVFKEFDYDYTYRVPADLLAAGLNWYYLASPIHVLNVVLIIIKVDLF
jgi:hypothetical protein